ncbi:MAG TPA: hypothetical protein VFM02_02030 [Candidatus Paceibacterota bacterium]|nr:hypothetical protein [Candidatus Paceibacterota bacterium]
MAKTITVTFDGHDCVGKTSLISALVHRLTKDGYTVTTLRSMTRGFNAERLNHSKVSKNVWFYISAWLITEKEISQVLGHVDFVLVDRSYYSTLVLARVFELQFPEFILPLFLRPDFSIMVYVKEEERLRRIQKKKEASALDYVTSNEDLIRKADEVYSSLGLIPIDNEGDLLKVAAKVQAIITR